MEETTVCVIIIVFLILFSLLELFSFLPQVFPFFFLFSCPEKGGKWEGEEKIYLAQKTQSH